MDELMNVKITATAGFINDNLDEVGASIREKTAEYAGIIVTEDTIRDGKKILTDIRKEKTALDDERKAIKKKWMAPYEAFEKRAKKIIALYDEPIDAINGQLTAYENDRKEKKRQLIREIYDEIKAERDCGEYVKYDRIYNPKWENATCGETNIREDIEKEFIKAEMSVETIKSLNSEFEQDGLSELARTGDLQAAIRSIRDMEKQMERLQEVVAEQKRQKEEQEVRKAAEPAKEPEPQINAEFPFTAEKLVTVKVAVRENELPTFLDLLDALGLEYEVM